MVCVRSLVPKLKNSASLATLIGGQGGARNLDHGADHVLQIVHAGLCENFLGHAIDDFLLVFQFLDAADQRDHDFRNHLHALLRHLHGGFEDGAGLHLGDLGISDAETAAAVAEHGVELVQLFHAVE